MDNFSPSDLKTIIHSKRANLYYLEHCRVLVNGGRVEFVTDEGNRSLYWNIPIANTTSLILGTGTSITQAAVRELAKAGIMIGFCGGGGTPLYSANEVEIELSWFSSQSEYRPTEYLQAWIRFWLNDRLRLEAAKMIQRARLDRILELWCGERQNSNSSFMLTRNQLSPILETSKNLLDSAQDTTTLLTEEARLTKKLFKLASTAVNFGEFVRAKNGTGTDSANRFLDHGNYLAYGLGATATWVLGLPHGLAILHGKTRRGGLVFDAADLIKDSIVLPQAFISAMRGDDEQTFRRACINSFSRSDSLDFIIDTLKNIAIDMGNRTQ